MAKTALLPYDSAMKQPRIMARMDIKGPNLVKTVKTEGLRVVGSPSEFATRYYEEGIDELIYLDVVASLYQRSLDFDLVRSVASNVFVPLTVGGGIRSMHDIEAALHAGADKIAINTYATQQPAFLQEAAERFGSQCMVLFVQAKKSGDSRWEVYTEGGREKTGRDALEWVQEALSYGIGEILLTSIDRDGTKSGYDLDLCRAVASIAQVPVIADGGAGSPEDVCSVLETGVDAAAISSLLHYKENSIADIKIALAGKGIPVRTV